MQGMEDARTERINSIADCGFRIADWNGKRTGFKPVRFQLEGPTGLSVLRALLIRNPQSEIRNAVNHFFSAFAAQVRSHTFFPPSS